MRIYLCRTYDSDDSDLVWGAFSSLDFLGEFSNVTENITGGYTIKIEGKTGGRIEVDEIELDGNLEEFKQSIKDFWEAETLK